MKKIEQTTDVCAEGTTNISSSTKPTGDSEDKIVPSETTVKKTTSVKRRKHGKEGSKWRIIFETQ